MEEKPGADQGDMLSAEGRIEPRDPSFVRNMWVKPLSYSASAD